MGSAARSSAQNPGGNKQTKATGVWHVPGENNNIAKDTLRSKLDSSTLTQPGSLTLLQLEGQAGLEPVHPARCSTGAAVAGCRAPWDHPPGGNA